MKKNRASIDLRTAHDVRRLRKCWGCGEMGDSRYMPRIPIPANHGTTLLGNVHGFCAVKMIGVAGILKLPAAEVGKLTIGEIGPEAMALICKAMP